jgi:4-hydroxy-tetrahydrodipicolinate synthase
MNNLFKGVCPVINIPFGDDGEIDLPGMRNIIEFTLREGCENIAVFAFNSEPHKMTSTEKIMVLTEFMKTVNHRAGTLVGIIENSIKGSIEFARLVQKLGGDGVILYPPALSTPAGEKLLLYFKSVAESIDIPVMVQDNPRSTGVTMSTEFLVRAYKEIENFRYIKVECPIPTRKIKDLIRLTDGGLKCYSGNGGIFAIDAFNCGAWGIMPGVSTVGYFVKLYRSFIEGDVDSARDIFENILPLVWYEDQSLEFYISCEKELLKRKEIITHAVSREPACDMDEYSVKELFFLYDRLKNF